MSKIAIIDYGVGNLQSVSRAFEKVTNAEVLVTENQDTIFNSDLLVLPGVGAFGKAIEELNKRNLVDTIKEYALTEKTIIGICLGMQLFATKSFEFGEYEGLDLIPGEVKKIATGKLNKYHIKIPFIGWAQIKIDNSVLENETFLNKYHNSSMYTVHSYQFIPDQRIHRKGFYIYDDNEIASIVKKNNIIGLQFHPEKSGQVGLDFLKKICNESGI